ncbi:MAG TPA: 2-amino-4-hydroxy-6-hydroxymethyldihydropteridine diphosphokinase [Myxococcota bacterium]|nr:2-amino-4-hydroxy-6-hydroxymethyldihydropteridine diphosphokinase [Myxococcota bacterium]
MTPVALSLGSSLGDRAVHLQRAMAVLSVLPGLRLTRASRVSWTPPVGGVARSFFLNAVVIGETDLSPHDLLAACKRLEQKLGRRPTRRFADRIIDIDLLLYGTLSLRDPSLELPHPRLKERDFFLDLLAEVWPDAPHPEGGSWRAQYPSPPHFPRVGCLRIRR